MRRGFGAALCALALTLAAGLTITHWDDTRYGADAAYALSIKPPLALAPAPTVAFPINSASEDALCALPGVGPTIARRIIAEREAHGEYYYPEDLLAVKGIGAKTLRRMRPLLMGD